MGLSQNHHIIVAWYSNPSWIIFSCTKACGDIDDHFKSKVVELLAIFVDEDSIVQMFIAAENDNLMELPAIMIVGGMVYLMAL